MSFSFHFNFVISSTSLFLLHYFLSFLFYFILCSISFCYSLHNFPFSVLFILSLSSFACLRRSLLFQNHHYSPYSILPSILPVLHSFGYSVFRFSPSVHSFLPSLPHTYLFLHQPYFSLLHPTHSLVASIHLSLSLPSRTHTHLQPPAENIHTSSFINFHHTSTAHLEHTFLSSILSFLPFLIFPCLFSLFFYFLWHPVSMFWFFFFYSTPCISLSVLYLTFSYSFLSIFIFIRYCPFVHSFWSPFLALPSFLPPWTGVLCRLVSLTRAAKRQAPPS